MKIIRQKFITRADIKSNPNLLYIFGDNMMRYGLGGQAKEMRGEENSFGIATKVLPSYEDNAFMKDTVEHFNVIADDFKKLEHVLKTKKYGAIVFPEDGIGTGIANLQNNAPILLQYINWMFNHEIPNNWNF